MDLCLATSAACHCEGIEAILVLLQLHRGTGMLLLEAAAIQVMVLEASSSSQCWEHHLGTGWRKAFLLRVYHQVMKVGLSLDQPKRSLQMKGLNRGAQDGDGNPVSCAQGSTRCCTLSFASVWTKAEQSKAFLGSLLCD